MINTKLQREILSNCSFYPYGARYSNLKPKEKHIANDLFNYHLQHLVQKGFLKNRESRYYLTQKGKSVVTNIDNETKDIALNYKVSTYIVPIVNGKVLLYKRLKHPQYGYTGVISGKMRYGERILDTAKREFREETQLKASFIIVGNLRQIRRDTHNNIIEDGIFYVCFTDSVSGNLIEKSKEGEYFWIPLQKVRSLPKLFKPSVEVIMNELTLRIKGKKMWEDTFIYEFEPEVEEY